MQLAQEHGLSEDVVLRTSNPRINVPMRLSIGGSSPPTWGYHGSGPHDTAFNILLAAGFTPHVAADLHDQFVTDFLYDVPQAGGTISRADIYEWIERQLACEHPSFEFRGLRRPAADGSDERIAAALGDDHCTVCGCGKRTLERRANGGFRRREYRAW